MLGGGKCLGIPSATIAKTAATGSSRRCRFKPADDPGPSCVAAAIDQRLRSYHQGRPRLDAAFHCYELLIEPVTHAVLIYSKSSLDAHARAREDRRSEITAGKTLLQILMLERIEPERNMHRYYVMSLEPTLFGDTGLRREWGRLGNKGGQTRLDLHEEPDEAREALEVWLQRKFKRGYRLRVVE